MLIREIFDLLEQTNDFFDAFHQRRVTVRIQINYDIRKFDNFDGFYEWIYSEYVPLFCNQLLNKEFKFNAVKMEYQAKIQFENEISEINIDIGDRI